MRVLYLTHRLPYAPNRGDRVRAFHTLRVLRACAHVDVLSLAHDSDELARAGEFAELGMADHVDVAGIPQLRNFAAGALRLGTATPLTHVLLNSPDMRRSLRRIVAERRPDVVLAYCSGMAQFAFSPELADLPVVVDMVDVDSLKWKALASRSAPPMRWIYRREARLLAVFEAEATRRAVATIVVNDRERTALQTIAPDARIEVVPSGVDAQYWQGASRQPVTAPEVVFCGVMNYAPNEEGALWLAHHIWPRVRQKRNTARLWLVGAQPTNRIRSVASDVSIHVTGAVPDVRPYLWRSAIAVAPLITTRGVQNKVLEAVAAGLPTIVTSQVADGLPSEVLPACRIADGTEAFADAIVNCLALEHADRRAIAESVDLAALSWEHRLAPLSRLLEAAARRERS
jgi:sugar transferase (PEP-CTERM/EpsH1 system associated)